MIKILKARLKEQRIVMNISPMILASASVSLTWWSWPCVPRWWGHPTAHSGGSPFAQDHESLWSTKLEPHPSLEGANK
jgi:hypothetical protein